MTRWRNQIVTLISSACAFVLVATSVYLLLWNQNGLNKTSPEDSPGVVLGAVSCLGWSLIAGISTATVVATVLGFRLRRSGKGSR